MINNILTIVILAASMLIVGCITTSEPIVEATKQWEGRYTYLESAAEALTKATDVDNSCQVWLLQPSTLSRLLKNVKK